MAPPEASPQTSDAAILFADIAGSSALYESAGNAVALAAVTRCLQSLRDIAASFAGITVKTIGDAILCRFGGADQAVQAAIAMQEQAAGNPLGVRIGLHYGAVVLAAEDVFGDSVNLAARIVALANPRQILTSGQSFDALPPHLRGVCRRLYATHVKGRSEEVTIFEVIWQQDGGLTMVGASQAARAPERLVLDYRGARLELAAGRGEISIGRDAASTIAVSAPLASRRHAAIAWKDGHFVLSDRSSNGTYIALENGRDILLRREEFILTGRGAIGLGAPPEAGGDNLVFEVQ